MDSAWAACRQVGAGKDLRGDTANGSYRNGVITISLKAETPYLVVAKHEITHHLKQTAAKSFGAYEAYAVETFAKSQGLSADALVQDRIAEAARSGDRLTAEQAREEIAADFTEEIFTDEKPSADLWKFTQNRQRDGICCRGCLMPYADLLQS